MFSQNNGYYYEQPETELFERQLPYHSIKLPHKEPHQKILRHTQKKYELDQLRGQILDRCKLEELEYLELLKKQREIMEEDIKRRKHQIEIHRMEEKIVENKEKNQKGKPKAKDSLDELRNEHEIGRSKAKTQRAESAYSNTATSVGSNSRVLSYYNKVPELSPITEVKPVTIEKQLTKDQQIKQLKDEMLNKYKFLGEAGKKPMKPLEYENNTQIKWWIDKVRKHREQDLKSEQRRKEQESIQSDTDSQLSNK